MRLVDVALQVAPPPRRGNQEGRHGDGHLHELREGRQLVVVVAVLQGVGDRRSERTRSCLGSTARAHIPDASPAGVRSASAPADHDVDVEHRPAGRVGEAARARTPSAGSTDPGGLERAGDHFELRLEQPRPGGRQLRPRLQIATTWSGSPARLRSGQDGGATAAMSGGTPPATARRTSRPRRRRFGAVGVSFPLGYGRQQSSRIASSGSARSVQSCHPVRFFFLFFCRF